MPDEPTLSDMRLAGHLQAKCLLMAPFRDGRGGFRTCDLSRVKRDHEAGEPPPEQGRLF
jgi:hypothetical protein